MQHLAQSLGVLGREGCLGVMRASRTRLQRLQTSLVERLDHVAHRLITVAYQFSDRRGAHATGTGQYDLTATHLEGSSRAQTGLKPLPLFIQQFPNIQWFSHASHYSTSQTILSDHALGRAPTGPLTAEPASMT